MRLAHRSHPRTLVRAADLGALLRSTMASLGDTPPEVVLFGNYGNGNTGDEAILRGVLAAFGDSARVTVVSRDHERVVATHPGTRAVAIRSVRGVRTVLGAKVVAIGGGGIFGNNMNLLPRLLAFLAWGLQVAARKQVVFVAIGAYRTTPALIQSALRSVARRALLVTVRDEESAETLAAPSTYLVADPGGAIPAASEAEVDAVLTPLALGTAPVLGISLKPTVDAGHDDRQVALATSAVRAWTSRHPDGRVLMLCLSDVGNFGLGEAVSDRTLAGRVAAAVEGVGLDVVGPDLLPWVMKGVIGRCDAVVAHRLHAQMFAHDEGVPVFGLSWERKADVFLEQIGAPRIDLVTGAGDDLVAWTATVDAVREPA